MHLLRFSGSTKTDGHVTSGWNITKVIDTHFDNKVGPGVLQSNGQQAYDEQNFTESTCNRLHMVSAFGILATLVFVERWARAIQVRSRFQTLQILFSECFITRLISGWP